MTDQVEAIEQEVVTTPEVEDQSNESNVDVEIDQEATDETSDSKAEHNDKVQKRINALVKERYELQRQLDIAKQQQAHIQSNELSQYSPELIEQFVNERAAQIAEQQTFNEKCNAIYNEGVAKTPEFADNIVLLNQMGLSSNNELFTEIVSGEAPVEIINYLSSNLDKYEELMSLTPAKMVRAIAKLETQLVNEPAKTKAKPVSNAPAPIKPVQSKGTSVTVTPEKDIIAWVEQRNAEERAKRRR